MKDETLLKISIIASIGGITLLYFSSQFISDNLLSIEELMPENVGTMVEITGNISSIFVSQKGHSFLKINDGTGEITGVLFKDSMGKIPDFKVGDKIKASGTLDEYQGELEIIIKELEVISL